MASLNKVASYELTGQTLLIKGDAASLSITFLEAGVVRVRLAVDGQFAPRRSWAILNPDEPALPTTLHIEADEQAIHLHSPALTVSVGRADGEVSFTTVDGQTFCADAPNAANSSVPVSSTKSIASGEHFYGFGERPLPLEKTGRRMVNWTFDVASTHHPGMENLYAAIPVFLSHRPGLAYAFYLNNSFRSRFEINTNQDNTWRVEADGGELDYFVFVGEEPQQALAGDDTHSAALGAGLPPIALELSQCG